MEYDYKIIFKCDGENMGRFILEEWGKFKWLVNKPYNVGVGERLLGRRRFLPFKSLRMNFGVDRRSGQR